MADLLKMDPARIERLRDPARLELVNPLWVLRVVAPHGSGPIVCYKFKHRGCSNLAAHPCTGCRPADERVLQQAASAFHSR